MSQPGYASHVVQPPGTEIDLGEHQYRHAVIQCLFDGLFGHTGQLTLLLAQQVLQALGDIQVGGEVVDLRDDAMPVWLQCQSEGEQFEQIHGDGIAHRYLTGRGARQRGDLLTSGDRQVDPVVFVPTGDQVMPPLFVGDPMQPLHLLPSLTRFLAQQFRMDAAICELVSGPVYSGDLRTSARSLSRKASACRLFTSV